MNFINQRKSSLLTRYVFKFINLNKNENLIKTSYFKNELSTNCSKLNNFTNHGSILIYRFNNNLINNSIKLSNLRFNTTQSNDHKNTEATKSNPFSKLEIDLEEDKEREKERDRLRKRQVKVTRITLYVFCGIFTGFIGWAVLNWGMPKKDEDGNEIIDRFSQYSQPKQTILRTWDELVNLQDSFNSPSRELLLPEPLTYPYMQPPYTLVIELKSLLVHFDWDYQTGWSAKTRPFLKKFLEQVGPPHFEVVIFTELSPTTAIGILEGIDKEGYIMHRLYKDSTRFIRGKHIKDLNVLNRDLAKTIQIEVDRDACSLTQRNCLVLEKWKGDTSDTALIDLAAFLRTIAAQNVEDVRDIISHYSQFDKPLDVFKKNQLKMMEEEEKRHKRTQSLAGSLASSVKKRI